MNPFPPTFDVHDVLGRLELPFHLPACRHDIVLGRSRLLRRRVWHRGHLPQHAALGHLERPEDEKGRFLVGEALGGAIQREADEPGRYDGRCSDGFAGNGAGIESSSASSKHRRHTHSMKRERVVHTHSMQVELCHCKALLARP